MTHQATAAAARHAAYIKRLRTSMRRALQATKARETKRAAKGRPAVAVTVTLDQIMAKLEANAYACALTGLEFWNDDADQFGPTMPSIDLISCDGSYDDANTRVVVYGITACRGRGSDDDLYHIAEALLARKRSRRG
ncbi:hypothetical protein AS156_31375 [Bradyrhizobium macuxiense]|uniref:Uncharacterized protein n=2 Tax=Bradyrhizobium macuxiense TaxID=1755647 RepID=A0A109K2K6_9BRAD|nr:hypothetical protein AS156_31375 [Bradyrhizobium macuxiense]